MPNLTLAWRDEDISFSQHFKPRDQLGKMGKFQTYCWPAVSHIWASKLGRVDIKKRRRRWVMMDVGLCLGPIKSSSAWGGQKLWNRTNMETVNISTHCSSLNMHKTIHSPPKMTDSLFLALQEHRNRSLLLSVSFSGQIEHFSPDRFHLKQEKGSKRVKMWSSAGYLKAGMKVWDSHSRIHHSVRGEEEKNH